MRAMNISSRPFSLETRSKKRLDLCAVRMTTDYSETADAMKLATPLNAEEATGDRRQDATLDKPWRNVFRSTTGDRARRKSQG
jgi:hypothetical protein